MRSLTAFLVTWAFVVLTVTGIILYIVPQGRVAYWIHWSLAGMEKEQWGWVHMMFGGVFIVTGILHLYFNWKPFKKYFADRVRGHLKPKQEIFVASALTAAIFAVSALNIPPASWVIDLNGWLKSAWITSPELEPPYGHAEEASLAGISRKMGLDLEKVLQTLEQNRIQFAGEKDTLENIARQNQSTPMDIYALVSVHKVAKESKPVLSTAEQIETEFSGTGLGRKTLGEICQQTGTELSMALANLSRAGIRANADDRARALADEYDKTPIDILVIMMIGEDS